jgi:hypothetical protein
MKLTLFRLALSMTLAGSALPCLPEDTLKIPGVARGDKVVVLVDARKTGGCSNDIVLRSSGTTVLPNNLLSSAGCHSEIAIFSSDRAMLLEPTANTWTDDTSDVHTTATLQPVIDVPVSVWIADAGARTKAKTDMARANVLYRANKVGVKFVPDFKNVWTDADAVHTIGDGIAAPTRTDLSCTDAISALQASNFYTPHRLNVYYVNLAFTGRNCAIKETPDCNDLPGAAVGDGNITYIGKRANRASLAHEIGHAFGLRPAPCGGHTENMQGFGPKNIMSGGGDGNRDRFTLGQVFRMNTQTDRWGGTMLIKNGLRNGPGRACAPLLSNDQCPALNKDWTRP